MLLSKTLLLVALQHIAAAYDYGSFADTGPRSVGELVGLAYPNEDAPEFIKLPGPADIAIAHNDSALLALEFLHIEPYPLQVGQNSFTLSSVLRSRIPENGVIELRAFNGWHPVFEGTIGLCEYTKLMKLDCPIETQNWQHLLKRGLLVPETADGGRYSFKAEVFTAERELVFAALGVVDLINDLAHHEEL